jgi:serine phosphatase RsbU (regulator of sigma subunit)
MYRHITRLLLLILLLTAGAGRLWAEDLETLRKKISLAHGDQKIGLMIREYQLSLESNDVPYQTRCLHALIAECKKQGNDEKEALAITERAQYYYNRSMSDSVIHYVPDDLKELAVLKQWDKYFETWSHLVNTYIYFGAVKNDALKEVQKMFDDALKRDNKYGMGIAYYAMGNVYLNMNNLDESAASYQKGLNVLSGISPLPGQMSEMYSYLGDVLNEQKKYTQLDSLTVRWRDFVERFIKERKFKPDHNKAEIDILWFYYDIACVQAALGLQQLERANDMLDEALIHFTEEASYQGMAWLFCKAQLYLQEGNYQKALDYNNRRLKLTPPDEDRAVYLTVISQRADILRGLLRFEEAANLYREMYVMKDSISSADTKSQLNEMNTLFHVGELERERERTVFRSILIIVGLVILALAIFLVFRMRAARRLKKAHDQLQQTHEELLTAYDQLEETTAAKERIESDLRIARNIQMGMVPRNFPERPDLDLFASMTPAKEVGGDLYGYVLIGDKLYFALGDVSGKGVPASLFMAQATRLFRTLAAQEMMPAEICTRINDGLSGEDNETCMFVTMFVGLADLTTGHLDFCNAGHNPPVLLRDGKAEFIEMIPNAPIGLFPGMEYEGEEIADISDCPLFVYTDGLNEAENRQQEQFTDERLLEILETRTFESCQQTVEMLREDVETHRDGAEPNDDLTMLCVMVKKAEEEVKD